MIDVIKTRLPAVLPPISGKSFLKGLAGVAVIYLLLFGFIALKAKSTLNEMENKLASYTASIERTHSGFKGAEAYMDSESDLDKQLSETSGTGLHPAPIEGLFEEKLTGLLPVIADNGLTPFKAYKKPIAVLEKPFIALAVIDYGLSEKMSESILEFLPPEISLILNPYSGNPDKWQKQAREHGHEIWVEMPIETEDYPRRDPGAQALLANESLRYNQDRLSWAMGRTTGYAGIAARTDGAFSGSRSMLQSLMKDIFGRGLGYLEINPAAHPFIETMAVTIKAPYVSNSVFLETTSLKKLESVAREKGYVVGILKPFPNSLQAVKTWTETLPAKGFSIAPVSALTDAPSPPPQTHHSNDDDGHH